MGFLDAFSPELIQPLAPASCCVLALRKVADYPQLLSTSRQITQGLIDVIHQNWNEESRTLTGTGEVGANLWAILPLLCTLGCHRASSTQYPVSSAGEGPSKATAGTLLSVKNFGAVGDGVHDDGPAIAAAFAAAKRRAGGTSVVFEKKTYKLGDNPTAWHYFQLENYSDLLIDGNGATLLCSVGNLGFLFSGGRDITVRGLVFDSSVPYFTQGEVIAVNTSGSLDVKIMEGYSEPPDEAFITANRYRAYGGGGRHMIVFEKGGKLRNTRMGSDHLYIRNITRVSPGAYRFHVKEDYLPRMTGVAVGNWVTYGFNKIGIPASVVSAKDKSPSIYAQIAADRVDNITFENIDIYASLNGGIRVSDMPGDVTIRNVNVIRKPGTRNLLSIISDALHLMNIRGRLILENCVIEAPGDDCLNVGTMLERIVGLSKDDNKAVALRTVDNRYYYYTIRKGDRLQFFNTSSRRILGVAAVTEVEFDRRKRTHHVRLDREIPGLDMKTVQVMNLDQMTRSTVIRNNTMKPYMRNAMLARAQNMTIQNNRLDCSGGGVIGLNLSYASGGDNAQCRNIRITGNTISRPEKIGIVLLNPYQDGDGLFDARRIEIIDNVFDVSAGTAIRISGVQSLTSRDNTFKQNGKPVKDGSRFTIFSKCVDAVIED